MYICIFGTDLGCLLRLTFLADSRFCWYCAQNLKYFQLFRFWFRAPASIFRLSSFSFGACFFIALLLFFWREINVVIKSSIISIPDSKYYSLFVSLQLLLWQLKTNRIKRNPSIYNFLDQTMSDLAAEKRASFARRAESLVERVRVLNTIYEVNGIKWPEYAWDITISLFILVVVVVLLFAWLFAVQLNFICNYYKLFASLAKF